MTALSDKYPVGTRVFIRDLRDGYFNGSPWSPIKGTGVVLKHDFSEDLGHFAVVQQDGGAVLWCTAFDICNEEDLNGYDKE